MLVGSLCHSWKYLILMVSLQEPDQTINGGVFFLGGGPQSIQPSNDGKSYWEWNGIMGRKPIPNNGYFSTAIQNTVEVCESDDRTRRHSHIPQFTAMNVQNCSRSLLGEKLSTFQTLPHRRNVEEIRYSITFSMENVLTGSIHFFQQFRQSQLRLMPWTLEQIIRIHFVLLW